jgi:hypothetical protein
MPFWCWEQKMLINIHPRKNVRYSLTELYSFLFERLYVSYNIYIITKRDFCYSYLINFLGIMFLALK